MRSPVAGAVRCKTVAGIVAVAVAAIVARMISRKVASLDVGEVRAVGTTIVCIRPVASTATVFRARLGMASAAVGRSARCNRIGPAAVGMTDKAVGKGW